MGILKNHLVEECDPRLPGYLSHSVKEAYRVLHDLINANPVLKNKEMRYAYGHIRKALVDTSIRIVLEKSDIPCKIERKAVSSIKNGYEHTMLEVKGAIISPSITRNKKALPKKALHRSTNSIKNAQFDLFHTVEDLNEKYDENTPPYMLLTYGDKNYQLQYVELGLPDISSERWIEKVDITQSLVLVTDESDESTIQKELDLSLTALAEELLRGAQDGTENI